jgi:hypothetical protein
MRALTMDEVAFVSGGDLIFGEEPYQDPGFIEVVGRRGRYVSQEEFALYMDMIENRQALGETICRELALDEVSIDNESYTLGAIALAYSGISLASGAAGPAGAPVSFAFGAGAILVGAGSVYLSFLSNRYADLQARGGC